MRKGMTEEEYLGRTPVPDRNGLTEEEIFFGRKAPLSFKKGETEDSFFGSFADWKDRKKEKAMKKTGTSSLNK